ncbi:hypothetical protein [Dactylosporangium sp. CA-139066]|uniref:hypothetical protein n=1 Tax=Dactylosporangium sp. CA-139066 TaxID=3239930 RepID=UPI003D922F21
MRSRDVLEGSGQPPDFLAQRAHLVPAGAVVLLGSEGEVHRRADVQWPAVQRLPLPVGQSVEGRPVDYRTGSGRRRRCCDLVTVDCRGQPAHRVPQDGDALHRRLGVVAIPLMMLVVGQRHPRVIDVVHREVQVHLTLGADVTRRADQVHGGSLLLVPERLPGHPQQDRWWCWWLLPLRDGNLAVPPLPGAFQRRVDVLLALGDGAESALGRRFERGPGGLQRPLGLGEIAPPVEDDRDPPASQAA